MAHRVTQHSAFKHTVRVSGLLVTPYGEYAAGQANSNVVELVAAVLASNRGALYFPRRTLD